MKIRMFIFILIICSFGLYTAVCNADEYNWPQWRGPNSDGISNETDWNPEALAGGPKILWKVNLGTGYSNVVIQDDRLYTMGMYNMPGTKQPKYILPTEPPTTDA